MKCPGIMRVSSSLSRIVSRVVKMLEQIAEAQMFIVTDPKKRHPVIAEVQSGKS
jgi:hypothetical protein